MISHAKRAGLSFNVETESKLMDGDCFCSTGYHSEDREGFCVDFNTPNGRNSDDSEEDEDEKNEDGKNDGEKNEGKDDKNEGNESKSGLEDKGILNDEDEDADDEWEDDDSDADGEDANAELSSSENMVDETDDGNDEDAQARRGIYKSLEVKLAAELPTSLRKHSEKGLLHDALRLGRGWSSPHVCKKKVKNLVLSAVPGFGKFLGENNYRYIPQGALIHNSAAHRMSFDPTYRPPNLRISETSAVKNQGDPVLEYIVQEDDDQ